MTGRHLILFFAFTLMFGAAASAQTADEVVQKNIEARGGLQKIKAIKSVRATGKLAVEGSGVELAITIQQKRPNAYRMEATFQGQSVIQAYDGETGWQINPFENITEPEKLIGDELRDAREQADFDGPLVDYKAKGHAVELLGKEAVQGKPAYKLKLTLKSGDVRTVYIDAASYLELRVTTTRRVNGGLRETDIYPGD
ncbi:MAG TPA: outer membrane lipoprotein-sorting protein, partial [Blastocatellia bacterium]|nr:outer membrane lipoprotein-sorting protein [Blastocatellia bacterium]